jgi:hypothetical protein
MDEKQKIIAVAERLENAGLPVGYILGEIDKAIGRENDIVRVGISINEVDFSKQYHSERMLPYLWEKEVKTNGG